MLLAIDIGNSNITLGGIQEGEILFEAHLATDATKTSDEYGVEIKDMLDLFGARVEEIRDCIVASVVPPVFNSVRNGIVKLTGKEPMVVGPGIKTGINILLEDPGATGADLIAAAVAAVDAYPTPLTVVDMGTATTIAVIDDGNAFLGGAVLPGLRISAEALSSRASLLPGIQLERPRRAIGKNTVECMQSGLMFGAAAMVDGLIDRMEAELGRPTTVVATGGVARFVVPLCRHEIALERDLQLKGLDLLYRKRRLSKKRLCHIFEKASVNRAQGLTACGRELYEAFPQAERTSRPRPGGPSRPIEASREKGDIPAARDAYIGSNKR